jgi:hypothetical protein
MFEKCSQPGAPLRNRTVDLLLTIEGQEGRWRSLTQINRSVRVGCGRHRSLRLLHFAAAQPDWSLGEVSQIEMTVPAVTSPRQTDTGVARNVGIAPAIECAAAGREPASRLLELPPWLNSGPGTWRWKASYR